MHAVATTERMHMGASLLVTPRPRRRRDDPLLADKEHLWDCPDPPCPADIDAEEDL
jgi:hypothetical protein